jgi:hypothetical protein
MREAERVMKKSGTIISDTARGFAAVDAGGDWHDVPRHHRYYGSTAFNGGERLTESRRGARPRPLNSAGI